MSFASLFLFLPPATSRIYTLSLHDALPIWEGRHPRIASENEAVGRLNIKRSARGIEVPDRPTFYSNRCSRIDRKSTRLNSSHLVISYAVFCLKKKIQQPYILSS